MMSGHDSFNSIRRNEKRTIGGSTIEIVPARMPQRTCALIRRWVYVVIGIGSGREGGVSRTC